MTTKTVRVGDVVTWDEVPSGAMILERDGFYSQRLGEHGLVIALKGHHWTAWNGERLVSPWRWPHRSYECSVTIVALNLTGNETADELRALAEQFDREHPTRDA